MRNSFSPTGRTLKNTLGGEVQSWRCITTDIVVVSIVSASGDVITGLSPGATTFFIYVISFFPFAEVVGSGGNSHFHNGGNVFVVITILTAFAQSNGLKWQFGSVEGFFAIKVATFFVGNGSHSDSRGLFISTEIIFSLINVVGGCSGSSVIARGGIIGRGDHELKA